jgi:hypothetical protein
MVMRERERENRIARKQRKERANLREPVEQPRPGEMRTVNGIQYTYKLGEYKLGEWDGGLLGGRIYSLRDEKDLRKGRRFCFRFDGGRSLFYTETFDEAAQGLQESLLASHDFDRQQVGEFEAALNIAPEEYRAAVMARK